MKRVLFLMILLSCCLAWVTAQDSTSLQVAPSDEVKYPNAADVINKTAPAATTPTKTPGTLPTTKPLVVSTPVPARPAAPAPAVSSDSGWFLKWTIKGDEDSALGWVQALGLPASLHALSGGLWEVWAGPLDAASLATAMKGQGGVASLVRR